MKIQEGNLVGYEIKGDIGVGQNVDIINTKGQKYNISIGKDNTIACSCSAFKWRGYCKHSFYVKGSMGLVTEIDTQNHVEGEKDLFVVKGKPIMNMGMVKGATMTNLETLLKQKVEEIQQRDLKEKKVTATTKGTEFKPENIPYIPDSNHPALNQHTLATPVRNAGFQDMSQVPPEYLKGIKKENETIQAQDDTIPAVPDTNPVFLETDSIFSEPIPEPVKPKQPEPTKPEFELKVDRTKMHSGGHYMPNESRPYKPV